MKIDGRQIATEILEDLKKRVEKLKEKGILPHVYVILLVNDPSTLSYIKQKKLKSEEIGAKITIDDSTLNITTKNLIGKIEKLNKDSSIHGIIVQRPLRSGMDEEEITNAIVPEKDVDGFRDDSKFEVPVGVAVLEILKRVCNSDFDNWLKSQNITVIGRGITAGKPIIKTFQKRNISPNVISSKTENREKLLKNSDVIVSAVGKPGMVNRTDLKKGVILIGVGMHEEEGKLKGDYNEEEIKDIASFYTPTPGGVGPVNVSMLMKNLIKATEKQS